MMDRDIRVLARHMIHSPAGSLVVTAVVWTAFWPWLSDCRRNTAATA
jgi:hypothetical protein